MSDPDSYNYNKPLGTNKNADQVFKYPSVKPANRPFTMNEQNELVKIKFAHRKQNENGYENWKDYVFC